MDDIVKKYQKLFKFEEGQIGHRWLWEMGDEIRAAVSDLAAPAHNSNSTPLKTCTCGIGKRKLKYYCGVCGGTV
jgi:hypothetical protein